jgi:hypothetical protein
MTSTPRLSRTAASLAALAVTTAGVAAVGTTDATASTVSPASATAVQRAAAVGVNVSIRLQTGGTKEKLGGVVRSRRAVCKQDRPVTLHFKAPSDSSFQVVRTDRTNARGVWVVPAPGSQIPAGRYFAKVAKKGATCRTARSVTITVR